jgi:hypothetical protein
MENEFEVETEAEAGVPTEAEKFLASMGVNIEDLDEAAREAEERDRRRKNADREICICGHSRKVHYELGGGRIMCRVTSLRCMCQRFRAVLLPENVWYFRQKTTSYGEDHALTKGIISLARNKKSFEWLVDPVCDVCGASEGVQPCPVDNPVHMNARPYESLYNALLCPTCMMAPPRGR